jgi:hypothetical protein
MDGSKVFESFQPTNVDTLYINQNQQARQHILTDYTMPEILLAKVGTDGIFNMDSYRDAFNYKNNDTKRERKILEEAFNKFWQHTVFKSEVSEIKIIPLEDMVKMKEVEAPKENPNEEK